jgi:RNA polymerase sigma-70 factor (ECF subfamily)
MGRADRSDEQLLHAVASGDRTAFAEFYDRYAPRVLGVLVRWMGQRADAEDVLQDTFCQVWMQAKRYDPMRSPPAGWVYLIARSRAVDVMRQRRKTVDAASGAEQTVESDADAALERGETSAKIDEALRQLPQEQRSALWLAFFEGLTHEQVASRQAVPLGTAKTRIRLAMHRLRDALAT